MMLRIDAALTRLLSPAKVNPVAVRSAGLILYRGTGRNLELLLVHPGGPFWQKRDEGAWSIPKGEIEANEDGLEAARREFREELGVAAPDGECVDLGSVRQAGGKTVYAWALSGDLDVARLVSTRFPLEWPPRSGTIQQFPEVDRAAWVGTATARRKLVEAQRVFVDRLEGLL